MNLRRQESKYHCHCGHLESRHGTAQGKALCWGCYDDYIDVKMRLKQTHNGYRPPHEYEPDNLSYLEMIVQEKEQNAKETA